MESLYEKNLYYKLIYWGWDDKKQDLLYFIEDLRDEANTNSRVDDPAPPTPIYTSRGKVPILRV